MARRSRRWCKRVRLGPADRAPSSPSDVLHRTRCECNSDVIVTDDPGASLDQAIESLAANLKQAVDRRPALPSRSGSSSRYTAARFSTHPESSLQHCPPRIKTTKFRRMSVRITPMRCPPPRCCEAYFTFGSSSCIPHRHPATAASISRSVTIISSNVGTGVPGKNMSAIATKSARSCSSRTG